MGGEGSMMHAIKSLKANRDLIKRRKLKSKDDVYGKKNVTKLHFKKSTRWDVIRVRKKMFIQKEKEKRRTVLAFVFTVLLFFLVYLLLK